VGDDNMSIWKVNNIFSEEELHDIIEAVKNKKSLFNENFVFQGKVKYELAHGLGIDNDLGRLKIGRIEFTKKAVETLNNLIKDKTDKDLYFDGASCFEYSKTFGMSNLPAHVDGDSTDLMINFQLESNTSWDLGLDLNLYSLEDNSAVIFNPNEVIHWRPIKNFNDGEFVRMIFFRFTDNKTNNSHLPLMQDHEMFAEVKKYRDELWESSK